MLCCCRFGLLQPLPLGDRMSAGLSAVLYSFASSSWLCPRLSCHSFPCSVLDCFRILLEEPAAANSTVTSSSSPAGVNKLGGTIFSSGLRLQYPGGDINKICAGRVVGFGGHAGSRGSSGRCSTFWSGPASGPLSGDSGFASGSKLLKVGEYLRSSGICASA